MKVFKFGGASVKDAASVKNVGQILKTYKGQPIVIVVSAMGKMTNAFEKVVEAYYHKTGEAESLFEKIKSDHFAIMHELFDRNHEVFADVNDTLTEVHWILEDMPEESFDYLYDQIVSIGEFVSSKILAAWLNQLGLPATWLDVRDVILTDNTYREARVDWNVTESKMQALVPQMIKSGFVVTQGFIGGTSENFTTTLGREGSDYTAAIFSTCLSAESMSVWKDVPGILTADPRLFKNVVKIDRLSYREAIEMTYYGAKVIHPKTIKPLQNKNIPLHVKSFENPDGEGTLISDQFENYYPPVVVVEKNQALIQISTTDFSFIAESHLSQIFTLLAELRVKVNMMQNSAISFSICVDNKPERLSKFVSTLDQEFKIVVDQPLELITVRHYNNETLNPLKKGKMVLFEEKIRDTAQIVVKETPLIEPK
ncbi:MAG: aspartate kinase [Bacteroidota bacterium]